MVAARQDRESLRRMVDELSDEDLPRARELLARLRAERAIANAPEDDEPTSAEDLEAIREAEDDVKHGRVVPQEEARRRLLRDP